MAESAARVFPERENRRVRPNVSLRRHDQWPVVEQLCRLEGESEFSPLAKKALAVLAEKHGIAFPVKEETHD